MKSLQVIPVFSSVSAQKEQDEELLSIKLDFARAEQPITRPAHPHILFSPIHYEPGYAYPLLVWLHHRGGDERQIMRIMPLVSMRNYVAVAPQGELQCEIQTELETANRYDCDVESVLLRTGNLAKKIYGWQDSGKGLMEAENRVFECITEAKQVCNIAPQRIFIAGFGSGATTALQLAFLYPEYFAGVASFGGTLPQNRRLLPHWKAARPLSVLLGTGQSNSVCSASTAETMELLHTAGVSLDVREYPCGQELTPAMLQDLNRWMMNVICG